MKSEPIKTIRKRFRRQWLLIAIDAMDAATTTPLRGHLLARSPRREDIYEEMLHRKGRALITYSDDKLPAGYAAAF